MADIKTLHAEMRHNIRGTDGIFPAAFKVLKYNLTGPGIVILLFRQITHAPYGYYITIPAACKYFLDKHGVL